jgi:hypothetical protein
LTKQYDAQEKKYNKLMASQGEASGDSAKKWMCPQNGHQKMD